MKKSTKIALLAAAALLIAGIVLCAVALKSVDFELARLSTSSIVNKTPQTASYDAADITEIQIELAVDDLYVVQSDDDQIHFRYTDRDNRTYSISNEDGILKAAQDYTSGTRWHQWITFDFGQSDLAFTLALPEDFAGSLQLSSDVGDVELEDGLHLAGNLDCTLQTGSFDADGFQASHITVQTEIGSLDLENCMADSLFLSAQTGDVELAESAIANELFCETDIGGIHLQSVTSANVQLSTQTGDIRLEHLNAPLIAASTDIGDIKGTIEGAESDYSVVVETDIGDSSLKNQTGLTDCKINFVTQTGDVEVSFVKS